MNGKEQANAARGFRWYRPREGGDPAITGVFVIAGSSAFADDDGGKCNGVRRLK
jgi:hypothetical protein